MDIKPLKFVLLVENILCVHRNRATFGSNVWQVLINLHTFCVLCTTMTNGVLAFYESSGFEVNSLYFYGSTTCSLVLILLAYYNSKGFAELLAYLTATHACVKDEPDYLKFLARKNKIIIFVATAFLVHLFTFIIYYNNFQEWAAWPIATILMTSLFYANTMACSFRYTFEHIVIYCILEVLSAQLKCVTRRVDEAGVAARAQAAPRGTAPHGTAPQGTAPHGTAPHGTAPHGTAPHGTAPQGTGSAIRNSQEILKEFDKWSTNYSNIKESSKLINDIFGLQLTYMIATVIFYYIIFLYSMTALGVAGELPASSLCFSVVTMSMLLVPLTMVARAAQLAENSARALRRRLGKLLIHSVCNADLYKATKDLVRFVGTRPLRTRALGAARVDMSLLPACVLFFTYYTVIALQFNNVV